VRSALLKERVSVLVVGFPFRFAWALACARWLPSRPPWLRLQDRCAMPAPSRLGVASPVMARGGSWSALGPFGCDPFRVMSTG